MDHFALTIEKQDKQCTYNVTMRHVRVTIVVVEKQNYYIFLVYVCSLIYTKWKTNAPYDTVLCGLSGCTIIFQVISQRT